MKLTDNEKSIIRGLIYSPQWQVIQRVAELFISEIKEDSPIRETNEQTLKELLLQEGTIRGIKRFFGELNNQVKSKE